MEEIITMEDMAAVYEVTDDLFRTDSELASLAFDRSNPSSPMYALEWREEGADPYIYELTGWPPVEVARYKIDSMQGNGLGIWSGAILVNHGGSRHCGDLAGPSPFQAHTLLATACAFPRHRVGAPESGTLVMPCDTDCVSD